MAAFATVRMPLDLTRCQDAAGVALSVVTNYPGTRHASLDETSSTVSFELIFPGNVSGLVRRLSNSLIPVGERADVTLDVRSLAPDLTAGGPGMVAERLREGAEVWDVAFERGHWVHDARLNGGQVEASIVPTSNAMHQIYDALLSLGLVAKDAVPASASHGGGL
jgi:hypothetical protein